MFERAVRLANFNFNMSLNVVLERKRYLQIEFLKVILARPNEQTNI